MKLIIDIPEEIWEKENFCDYFGAWSEKLQEIIKSGTVVYESEEYKNYVSRQSVKELIRSGISTDIEVDQDYVCELIDELPPVTPEPNRCNQCKYYEGVHDVQGHAPCSFLKCGGVLWDWYCSNYESYKEGEENGIN